MGGKAEELGAKALVDVFGVSCVELVGLVGISPLCPASGLVAGAKFVELGEHLIA